MKLHHPSTPLFPYTTLFRSEAERLGFVRQTRLTPDPAVGISAEREAESGLWSVGPALAVGLPLFNQGQPARSEEHTSELQSQSNLVCRLLLEKKKTKNKKNT